MVRGIGLQYHMGIEITMTDKPIFDIDAYPQIPDDEDDDEDTPPGQDDDDCPHEAMIVFDIPF